MKRNRIILSCGLSALLLSSCVSTEKITYLYGGENVLTGTQPSELYDARIMPKDLLTITVSCSEPELAAPFNLGGSIAPTATGTATAATGAATPSAGQTYLVDNEGNIDFPIVRTLHLGGMTKGEAEALIKEKLRTYLNESPIVNVRMVNYKFSVVGAVRNSNTFTTANEKVNLFEALAMAGDVTPYGKKDCVKLLREDGQGRKTLVSLNLNDPHIVNSPYYNLQQNDILYVESTKAATRQARMGNVTPWISIVSVISTLASLATVLVTR